MGVDNPYATYHIIKHNLFIHINKYGYIEDYIYRDTGVGGSYTLAYINTMIFFQTTYLGTLSIPTGPNISPGLQQYSIRTVDNGPLKMTDSD